MRFFILGFMVVACIAAVFAAPTEKAACPKACVFNYVPICGKSKAGREKQLTFGNDCVLKLYNCEHSNEQFEKIKDGECPGNVDVRLQ